MKIAAVIYTYNRKEFLAKCLEALFNQTHHIDEIIVVDDVSTDGTEQFLRQEFPSVTHFKLEQRSGGAGSIRAGMELAYNKGYDWIWVLDDDAWPADNALEELVNVMTGGQIQLDTAGIFVGRRVWPADKLDPTIPESMFEIIKNTPFAGFPISRRKLGNGIFSENIESINYIFFSGILVSRKAIEVVGFPLKDFFIFWDDIEYSQRMIDGGFNLYQVLTSYIIHPLWKPYKNKRIFGKIISLEDYKDWRSYYVTRNEILLYKWQHRADPSRYSLFWMIIRILKWFLRAVLIQMIFRLLMDDKGKIKYIFGGAIDGILGKAGKGKWVSPG